MTRPVSLHNARKLIFSRTGTVCTENDSQLIDGDRQILAEIGLIVCPIAWPYRLIWPICPQFRRMKRRIQTQLTRASGHPVRVLKIGTGELKAD